MKRADGSRPRSFAPLTAEHPAVGKDCAVCKAPFVEGDVTTLIPLGPGSDPEEQEKAREGRPYNAVAAMIHWTCAGGTP